MEKEQIILGVDPGTTVMGFGILRVKGKKLEVLELNTVMLHKLGDHYLKLKRIFERTLQIIDEHNPDHLAIEAPFFGKNVQSMLKLGRAQGVVMAAALYRDIPLTEYAPKKIKQSITGSGNASKEQVSFMLKQMLNLKSVPKDFDATDGLAAAVCHHLQQKNPAMGQKSASNWAAFIKQNPDRKL
ncbi:MAG: crossover junction endodeoxyribonuclease RuvC [Flavobacteriales bacterium]